MKKILRIGKGLKVRRATGQEIYKFSLNGLDIDMETELIQVLIPIGLWHVREILEQKVRQLARERYQRLG